MTTIGWDKFRILITNVCNYRCAFCHNEGQAKNDKLYMSIDDFKKLVDFLQHFTISEFTISGGEPFLHPRIIDMLLYACNKLTCDISCATNLSQITDDDIAKLTNSRIKFNIQFPFIDKARFKNSTGSGRLNTTLSNIHKMRVAGIKIGLNTVIQFADSSLIEEIILFAAENHLPLKLLPQIGNVYSSRYKDWVFPIIRKYAINERDKGTGAIRWEIIAHGNETSILYIDSPCFSRDIVTCRNFSELRIHPGLFIQSCILKPISDKLDFQKGEPYVINQLLQEWNNFKNC